MQPVVRTINMAFLFLIFLSLSAVTVQAAIDSDLLEGLSARTLGPAAVSGRITAIDVVSSDPNHIVIGAATGGVWISENGGLNWTPVFDEQAVASIGAVAIDQSNPDVDLRFNWNAGLEAMDQFMNEDLAEFIEAVDAAGIGLFRTATAINPQLSH